MKPSMASLLAGAGVFGLGGSLAALAPGYWSFAAARMVIGAAALTFVNGTNNMMQLSAEPAMRGRVMALRVSISLGGIPIGAPITGWVANHFDPRWPLTVGYRSGLHRYSCGSLPSYAPKGANAGFVSVPSYRPASCRAGLSKRATFACGLEDHQDFTCPESINCPK